MRYIFLFVLISWSSGFLAQSLPSKDKHRKDSLNIEDAADTDPEFIGGFEGLSKYLNDSLRWDEVTQWQARKKKAYGQQSTRQICCRKRWNHYSCRCRIGNNKMSAV